jgi:hypothetical protein
MVPWNGYHERLKKCFNVFWYFLWDMGGDIPEVSWKTPIL